MSLPDEERIRLELSQRLRELFASAETVPPVDELPVPEFDRGELPVLLDVLDKGLEIGVAGLLHAAENGGRSGMPSSA